jgi:cytochrome P450
MRWWSSGYHVAMYTLTRASPRILDRFLRFDPIGNLLSVPQEERARLRDWSLAILGALEPVLTPEQQQRGNTAVTEFLAYLRTLIARRRHDDGMLMRLIAEPISETELLHNCVFLLNAGHETTTNLIGNALYLLLAHEDQLERLRTDSTLIKSAIEEVLRYESPNQLGNRLVVEPVKLTDTLLEPGAYLHLCIGAANRDPEVFPEPDRFDVGRTPNAHLAFAAGGHACAGMSVARLEAQIAIQRIVQRFPRLRFNGEAVRGSRARFRGFTRLPLAVH